MHSKIVVITIELLIFINYLKITCETLNCDKKYQYLNKTRNGNCLVLLNSDNFIEHKIVSCSPVANKNNYDRRVLYGQSIYRCECMYMVDNFTNDDNNDEIEEAIKCIKAMRNDNKINKCVEVHPAMAIKGYNLVYHKWVNRDHCLNLCLKTSKLNGDPFDCQSFEHWHNDCTYGITPGNTSTIEAKSTPCSDYSVPDSYNDVHVSNHIHRNEDRAKLKRNLKKFDLCVLSNQTIKSAIKYFAPNNGVTYYEILCNRQTISKSSDKELTNSKVIEQYRTTKPTDDKFNQIQRNTVSSRIATSLSYSSTTLSTTESTTTVYKDTTTTNSNNNKSQKCDFNPCLNDATCIYVKNNQFTCICADYYYGIYCEYSGIKTICLKDHMEILVGKEVSQKLSINLSDFYVNNKQYSHTNEGHNSDANSYCISKIVNQTHIKFQIPYEKCDTIKTEENTEIVFINILYSLKEISNDISVNTTSNIKSNNKEARYYISESKCKLKLIQQLRSKEDDDNNNNNMKNSYLITNNDANSNSINNTTNNELNKQLCVIDSLNMNIKFYSDPVFENLLPEASFSKTDSKTYVDPEQSIIYVEISVSYTDESYNLFKKLDLKTAHLTIFKFWATLTNTSNSQPYLFIDQGCPTKYVKFLDSKYLSKNRAIRFSIRSSLFNIEDTKFYFHCLFELCTNVETNKQLKLASSNYVPIRVCENSDEICKSKFDLINNSNDEQKKPQQQSNENSKCQLKRTNGPFNVKSKNLIQNKLNSNSASYTHASILLTAIQTVFIILVFG